MLLLDLDPQAHLTYSLGIMAHELPRSMGAALMGECELAEVMLERGGLTIVPASVGLAGTEVDLAGVKRRETRLRGRWRPSPASTSSSWTARRTSAC